MTIKTMKRRSLLKLPLGALAAGGAVSAGSAAAAGKVRPRASKEIAASPLSVGMETLDRKMWDPSGVYDHLGRLGVKWARLQTGWARTERVRGQYDFKWLDDVIDALLQRGIQPWLSLSYGNRLYSPEAPDESAVGFAPLTDAAREGWVRYVRAIVKHYRGRVKHWEIWNEPNGKTFWRPQTPDPAGYASLVKLTAAEIRRVTPDAFLIGGALAGLGNVLEYLEAALEAGLAKHVQCISYHPYRQLPETGYDTEFRAFRALVSRYGQLKIWQGENGVRSVKSDIPGRNWVENETQQAKWLLRRILLDLRLRVDLTSYFHTIDIVNYNWGSGPSGESQHMGLMRSDYSLKPSYFAYQCLCALFDSETVAVDFMVAPAAKEAEVASFARRGYALCAYWVPAPLLDNMPPGSTRVRLWTGRAVRLEKPVLINPLTAEVTALDKATHSAGYWSLPGLPLADFPYLITDASLV